MAFSPKRFESGSFDLPGLWGVAGSSIDWCERNYTQTRYIAEFWNTMSCSLMALPGAYAILIAHRLGLCEFRWKLHGIAWFIVAAGSAAFHGTLSWSGQLADEVPMMWAVFVWIFCVSQIYDGRARIMHRAFGLYASVYSALHVYYAFVIPFQVQYAILVVSGVLLTDRMLRVTTGGRGILPAAARGEDSLPGGYRTLISIHRHHIGALAAAFIIWIVDQVGCESLHDLPFGLPNPQLHAWWHVLLGWSIHLGFQYSMALRVAQLRGSPENVSWRWSLRFIPVAVDPVAKHQL